MLETNTPPLKSKADGFSSISSGASGWLVSEVWFMKNIFKRRITLSLMRWSLWEVCRNRNWLKEQQIHPPIMYPLLHIYALGRMVGETVWLFQSFLFLASSINSYKLKAHVIQLPCTKYLLVWVGTQKWTRCSFLIQGAHSLVREINANNSLCYNVISAINQEVQNDMRTQI